MIILEDDLTARVFARDGGCCVICLTPEHRRTCDLVVRKKNMDKIRGTESMEEVILICEEHALVVERWLALFNNTAEEIEAPVLCVLAAQGE